MSRLARRRRIRSRRHVDEHESRGGGALACLLISADVVSVAAQATPAKASPESFRIRVDETGVVETFRYADVRKVKGLPTPKHVKLAVAAGAVVGFYLLLGLVLTPKT